MEKDHGAVLKRFQESFYILFHIIYKGTLLSLIGNLNFCKWKVEEDECKISEFCSQIFFCFFKIQVIPTFDNVTILISGVKRYPLASAEWWIPPKNIFLIDDIVVLWDIVCKHWFFPKWSRSVLFIGFDIRVVTCRKYHSRYSMTTPNLTGVCQSTTSEFFP